MCYSYRRYYVEDIIFENLKNNIVIWWTDYEVKLVYF